MVRLICSCCSASGSTSAALSPSVVPPGEVALDVVVDTTAEGKRDEVVVDRPPPKLKPTPAELDGDFEVVKPPNRFEWGFGDPTALELPELPKRFAKGVGCLVGVAVVTLTVGLLPNLIGVSGFHVWSAGASENASKDREKGLVVFAKLAVEFGLAFSFSSEETWRMGLPVLSLVIRSKRLPPGVLVPELGVVPEYSRPFEAADSKRGFFAGIML